MSVCVGRGEGEGEEMQYQKSLLLRPLDNKHFSSLATFSQWHDLSL